MGGLSGTSESGGGVGVPRPAARLAVDTCQSAAETDGCQSTLESDAIRCLTNAYHAFDA